MVCILDYNVVWLLTDGYKVELALFSNFIIINTNIVRRTWFMLTFLSPRFTAFALVFFRLFAPATLKTFALGPFLFFPIIPELRKANIAAAAEEMLSGKKSKSQICKSRSK